jgi:hypothetical protein
VLDRGVAVPICRRTRLLAIGLIVPLVLSGCGAAKTADPAAASAARSAAATKAVFVEKADAVCKTTDTRLSALPHAKSAKDYAALTADFAGTVTIFQSYFAAVDPLVAASPDRDELTKKWLTVEKGDFNASLPIIEKILTGLKDHDGKTISSANTKLKNAPDHTDNLITFFTHYGLTSCVDMESNSSDAIAS